MNKRQMNDYFLLSIKKAGLVIDVSSADEKTSRMYRRGFLYEYEVFERCPDCLTQA